MRKDVIAFQELLQAVQNGKVSREDAAAEVEVINSSFAVLWKYLGDNNGQIGVILAIIAILLTLWPPNFSNNTSEKILQAQVGQVELQQKILEELQRQRAGHAAVPSKGGGGNRHDRRKGAAIERKSTAN